MNYYPFHLGDYASHTGHLEPMEDLAYRRMLDAYYLRETPLPAPVPDVARLIRMRQNVTEVEAVLNEFFMLTSEGWRHSRCDEEIAKMQDKQAKARASAAASVNARKAKTERKPNERSTDVELPTPTPTPSPDISPNPPATPGSEREVVSAAFDAFWKTYPKKVGKDAAEKVWARKVKAEDVQAVMDALDKQRSSEQWNQDGGRFIPHPSTWLNQGRWKDEDVADEEQPRSKLFAGVL